MKSYKYSIATVIMLLANLSFGQESFIKGTIVDYETGDALAAVTIYESENPENGTVSDGDGHFEINLKGNTGELHFSYLSFYAIKFLNIHIPKNKNIDFGAVKLVSNHQMDDMTIGGPPFEPNGAQIKKDKKLRKHVLKHYKIKILGKKMTPYFEGKFLVFDFNKINKN